MNQNYIPFTNFTVDFRHKT